MRGVGERRHRVRGEAAREVGAVWKAACGAVVHLRDEAGDVPEREAANRVRAMAWLAGWLGEDLDCE